MLAVFASAGPALKYGLGAAKPPRCPCRTLREETYSIAFLLFMSGTDIVGAEQPPAMYFSAWTYFAGVASTLIATSTSFPIASTPVENLSAPPTP